MSELAIRISARIEFLLFVSCPLFVAVVKKNAPRLFSCSFLGSIISMRSRKQVRVRIAPSPTGNLHIGTARTALFNWLYARKTGGEFVLRIEDTDRERSDVSYEEDIMEGLRWLGLEWDEGPVRQSERTDMYRQCLEKLLYDKRAYWCFCSKEDLEAERQSLASNGLVPMYSGKCRELDVESVERKQVQGVPGVIRFRVPNRKVAFKDMVRGRVVFDAGLMGDIVVAKGLDEPLYNFAAAVDDHDMRITHVIRGEDHIANTPKQLLIGEALGFESPVFAHVPLILGSDKAKLSKRAGEVSLNEYRKAGYVPEAMLNFLALMGFHPQKDREVFGVDEMIKEFSFERVQKSGAIYNKEKLDWLNGYYIRTMPFDVLVEYMHGFVPEAWEGQKLYPLALKVERERMKSLKDFQDGASFFFELPEYDKDLLIWKKADGGVILENLKAVMEVLEEPSPSTLAGEGAFEGVEKAVVALADERGRGEVLWPLRVALSGQKASPGPFEIMGVLGVEESVERVRIAIEKLENAAERPDPHRAPRSGAPGRLA
jgi:glutamyl-tRNA synthetase